MAALIWEHIRQINKIHEDYHVLLKRNFVLIEDGAFKNIFFSVQHQPKISLG